MIDSGSECKKKGKEEMMSPFDVDSFESFSCLLVSICSSPSPSSKRFMEK